MRVCIHVCMFMYECVFMCVNVYVRCMYVHVCVCMHVRGDFNKFPDVFVQSFKIVVDSWKFSMLLLYIL